MKSKEYAGKEEKQPALFEQNHENSLDIMFLKFQKKRDQEKILRELPYSEAPFIYYFLRNCLKNKYYNREKLIAENNLSRINTKCEAIAMEF